MALDNAQFISELSIIDPPGTDAVAEGDDHIRTTKRATQQSFPNINAAVPQTAAQMGQMAIKNEVNTFTQQQLFATGSAAAPSVSFAGFPTMGMFRKDTNSMAFAVGGVEKLSVGVGAINSAVPYGSVNGSAAFPAYAFAADNTSGMYKPGTSLGFSVAGADAAFLLPGQFRMISDGVVAAPSYGFQSEINTGMFLPSANLLGFTVGGAQRVSFGTSNATFGTRLDIAAFVRFNNFNSDHGLEWRANGQLTWQFLSVHSSTKRLRISRFIANVFQDIPFELDNATGQISMATLPTSNPGGTGILWKSGGFVAIT